MFNPLLPSRADNTYGGYKVALWLFGALLFIKTAMCVNCIFNGYEVATKADGVPLATFSHDASQTIVNLFASWGLAHLCLAIIGVVVLVRYRSLVSFMFALLLAEQLSRRVLHGFIPTVRVGAPPATIVNLILLTLMVSGLALSLLKRRGTADAA